MKFWQCCRAVLVCSALLASCPGVSGAVKANSQTKDVTKHIVGDAPLPIWHQQFSVQFNETTRIFVTKHTAGTWYYDAVGQREALYREKGNGDRYCGSIHPLTETPCVHIVTGGKRYLVFPDLGECCMCCTAERGCGVLSPGWLEGASFEGTMEIQGLPAYKWRRDGLQPNYWYATADEAQVPLELDQMPNDRQTFWPSSFREGPPPDEVFELPAGCSARCPLASICTIADDAGGIGGALGDEIKE